MKDKRKNKITDYHRIYHLYYDRFKLLALNMFRWEGLPPSIQGRNIEKALYDYGKAVFFEDENLGVGLMCLGAMDGDKYNVHGDPLNVIATGYNFNKKVTLDDSTVLLYNNDLALPTHEYVDQYAHEMAEVKRSINANIRLQKFPYLFETNKNNKNSLKQLFKEIEDGEPAIFGNKDINIEGINVLGLQVPYVADKLNEYRYDLEREILTFFSLNNTFEKKERLLVDEINSNNDFISRQAEIMYQCRLKVAEELKKKFGYDVKVIKTNDLYNKLKEEGKTWEDIQ